MIGLAPARQYSSVMAVTDTEHKPERIPSHEDEQESGRRGDEKASEDSGRSQADTAEDTASEGTSSEGTSSEGSESGASEGPESDESEDSESGEAKKPEKRERAKGVAGGVGIFLVLAIYFVWIGSEMGSHAISGTFEMWAIFGAILLGVLALVAGGAMTRTTNSDKRDKQ
jgi:cobalamin biosynthesis Mg chelatase CobN